MITGMSATSGSALRADRTAQPSMPGIMTSSVIASGRSSRTRRSPSSPPSALTTRKPSLPRNRSSRSRTVASSSMTRTVLVPPTPPRRFPRPRVAPGATSPGREHRRGDRMVNVEPARLALDGDVPAHHAAQAAADRQPSPVPPYLRVVEASACENSSKSLPNCSGVMPMPVSLTAKVMRSFPSVARRGRRPG